MQRYLSLSLLFLLKIKYFTIFSGKITIFMLAMLLVFWSCHYHMIYVLYISLQGSLFPAQLIEWLGAWMYVRKEITLHSHLYCTSCKACILPNQHGGFYAFCYPAGKSNQIFLYLHPTNLKPENPSLLLWFLIYQKIEWLRNTCDDSSARSELDYLWLKLMAWNRLKRLAQDQHFGGCG